MEYYRKIKTSANSNIFFESENECDPLRVTNSIRYILALIFADISHVKVRFIPIRLKNIGLPIVGNFGRRTKGCVYDINVLYLIGRHPKKNFLYSYLWVKLKRHV